MGKLGISILLRKRELSLGSGSHPFGLSRGLDKVVFGVYNRGEN